MLAKPSQILLSLGFPASGNASAGSIEQEGKATAQQAHDFLTGVTFNGSAGALLGGGITGNSSGVAYEASYTPQVGGTVTYTFLDIDLATNNWDLFP